MSKLLERHIYQIIYEHILQEDIFPECQWGFLSCKSTTTALLAGVEICVVFLDLQKASVPHRNLLHIMKHIGIHPIILKWTCSYLTYRTQRVVVDGVISSEVHALSGVPQGSVLGPLLFLMYINGITKMQLSLDSLYADDILLFKPIRKKEDYKDIQQDIDTLYTWSASSRLIFNPEKCNHYKKTI